MWWRRIKNYTMKKIILIISALIFFTLSTVAFIHFSNDHMGCSTENKTKIDSNGILVKEEKHICKEKFSF
jgi:hypothetical protein